MNYAYVTSVVDDGQSSRAVEACGSVESAKRNAEKYFTYTMTENPAAYYWQDSCFHESEKIHTAWYRNPDAPYTGRTIFIEAIPLTEPA